MDELYQLYEALFAKKYFTKSFEEFQSKFQDPVYQDRVFNVVDQSQLFTQGRDRFFQKFTGGTAPMLQQQQEQVTPMAQAVGEPVKKKEEQELPPWLQEREQARREEEASRLPFYQKPKEEQLSPFLESIASASSSGYQGIPDFSKPVELPEYSKYRLTPEQIAALPEPIAQEEEDYFTGAFGNVLRTFDEYSPIGVGDFVDDLARSVAQGYRNAQLGMESLALLKEGTVPTTEQIQKFLEANKNAKGLGSSKEMQDYQKIYEEEGKGFWGVVKGLILNPTVVPELITSSLVTMAANKEAVGAGLLAVEAGAAYGGVTGSVAGGVGAGPGAAAGATAALPYAFGLASSIVDMGATYAELLQEELGGKEATKENVKAILEDPNKQNEIRNKAIIRGIAIGTIDAFTGKLASGVGAKTLFKSAATSSTGQATRGAVVKSVAQGAGIEAVGGATGEATGRGLIGQEMDVSEIALEGLSELPGGIRSTYQARYAKPEYKINGQKVTAEEVDNVIETMTPDQLAQSKIVINNDYTGRAKKMQDKIVDGSIEKQVKEANPELNQPSIRAIVELEKELTNLEGNKTQTGKDKAASIRQQIKDIQANPLQEEGVIPNEISSLKDDDSVVINVESLDEIPEQFKDRARKRQGEPIEIREKILGLPIGGKWIKVVGEGYSYTLTGKEIKDYAIQEQTTSEVPLQPEARVGEEVAKGEPQAEPQVTAEETVKEEVEKPKSFFDWLGGLSKPEVATEEVATPIETVTKEEVDEVITPEEQEALDQEVKDLESVLGLEPTEEAPKLSEEKKQEVVENVNKLRELEKEKNKDNLDEQYAIGSEETVEERIDRKYDEQLDLFESIAAPAAAPTKETIQEEVVTPEETEAAPASFEYDSSNPNHDSNMSVLGKTLEKNKITPSAEPRITQTEDSAIVEYLDQNQPDAVETSITFKRKKDGSWSAVGAKIERTPPAPAPAPAPSPAPTTVEQPSFIQTLKDKIRELGTPKMGLSISLTPATERVVGKGKSSTKRIVGLTAKYDETFNKLESTTDENERVKLAKDLEQIQEQILDGVKKDVIESVSKIKGVSVRFDDNFTGRWDGKYEPSFNMQLFVKANADANAVNQMLYDLAEQYSQDAFIVTSTDATSKERINKKDSVKLPLSETIGKFAVLSPVADITFKKPLTTQQLSDLAKALNVGELGYSLNRNRLQVGFYPYVDEKKQAELTPEEQEQEKEKQYTKELAAYEKAIESVFGEKPTYGEKGTKPNEAFTAELSVKRSSYISAKNAKSTDRERFYDRGDVLQEHQKELAGIDRAISAFKKLRDRQIKGETLTKEQEEYLQEMAGRLQPVIQSTIDSAKESYEEAKVEVEDIAEKSISGLKAFVSKFPIKRPSRASVKTINWYGAAAEKLGDGARVNIIVENVNDADKVFNTINKNNPKKNDKELRRIKEKTDLGFPKRLIEVRTSNGVIAEMQVISSEAYLAKDGVKGFPEDKKSFASKRLSNVQKAIGFKIPDGLGHYFYEIHRDTNVPQEIRNEALRLSNQYYEAFASPESSALNTKEGAFKFMTDLANFKQTVDAAEKSSWDKGNDGKSPDSISKLTPKSVLKYTPAPAPAPAKPAPTVPTTGAITSNQLREEYILKLAEVRTDKNLTQKQKDAKASELKAEYQEKKKAMASPKLRTSESINLTEDIEGVPSVMVLTGNENVVKGENINTVATGAEDYTIDEIMSTTHNRTSAVVGLAENIASGTFTAIEEDDNGNKFKVNISIPYVNKSAARKIAKLKNEIAAIKGKSKQAIKEKNKKVAELNKIVKSVINDFTNTMSQNILALYDSLTDDFVQRSKEWYVGANRMANSIATAYNITTEQVSGIMAVLSPQQDWFNNVSMAERTIEVLSTHSNTPLSLDIYEKAIAANSKNKKSQFTPLLMEVYEKYGNISISEMQSQGVSLDVQAIYLRAIDQALYSNKVVMTSPSGKFLGVDTTPVRWASASMISSAISIYRNGDISNINQNLGNGNKVRNFYNNIADPNSPNKYVTADTHALSAALNLPISAKVASSFGIFGGNNNPLYALVKTAYIDAANAAGILPREMQSVTWEAQRTGVNDKNRTKEVKQRNFKLAESLRTNEQTPYERATEIITANRSQDPVWGKADRVVTQRPDAAIRKGLESRANSRASQLSTLRGGQRVSGGGTSSMDIAIAKGQTNSTEEVLTQHVGRDLSKVIQLVAKLQQAFPNVIVSVDPETFNNVMNSDGVRPFVSDGVVIYGVTVNGDIYINPEVHKSDSDLFNTSIHEFGHVWQDFLSTTKEGQALLNRGYELIKEAIGVDSYITNLYNTQLKKFNGDERKALNEVTSILIGNKGAEVVNRSIASRIKDWLSDVWSYISSAFKMSSDLTQDDIQNMTLDQFIGTALADMLSGKQIKMSDSQLKTLKDADAAFSTSQNIFDIVSVGRQNGFSDASIKQLLLKRGFKSTDIDAVMQVNLNLFDKLPPAFANVQGGVSVGMDLYNQVLNKLIEFQKAYGYKSMADIRQKGIELLQSNPIFQSQTDQMQKELIVGFDKNLNTKANKSVSALIAGIKNDLKQRVIGSKNLRDAQIAMRTFIRNALPKSKRYSQAQINNLTKIITDTTVDSFMAQSEKVIEIVEKQIEKMRKDTLREILTLVTKKAQPAKTTTGKRRSKGLDAQGQSFFEAARDIIKAAILNDNAKMMELSNEIADMDAIDEIIAKDLNGEKLTTLEQRLLDKAIAFDTFSDLMGMDLDQLSEVLDSLKDERRESIARLKQTREARALRYNQIRAEADAAVQESFPILFTDDVDADGNAISRVKDKNDFDADQNAIWNAFNKLKIWDGIKKFSERWSLDSLSKIFGFFRNNIANIEFFTNLYDVKGKFFTTKIYDKLNTMYDSYLGGFYKEQDNLDVLANSIDGITKGYKQIRNMLEIGVHEFTLNGKKRILSGDQMLRLYALSKNSIQRDKLSNMGFTDADMARMESLLPEQTREFADKLVQYFSNQYYESVNSVYSSLNDVNLQYVPNYFPTITVATSVDGQVLLDGNFNGIFNAETAPALRERSDTSGDIDLAPDFTSVVESHFQNMEKYKAFAAGVKEMNALFQSKGFNALMEQTSTKQLFKNLVNYTINPNAGPKVPATLMDKLYNKYTGFALAFKAIQLPKQLTAFIFAYDNYQFLKDRKVPGLDMIMFMVDNAKVIATLPSQFKKAREISPTFRDRVAKGIEGDVFGLEAGSQTFKSAEKRNTLLGKFLRGFKTAGAAPTISGDLLSVMSYMAVYNRNIANGMNPEKALLQFNNFNATLQTRRGTEKSTLQTSQHAAVRAFTMFGSTAFLQLNGAAISMKNMMRSIFKERKFPSQTDIRRFVISYGLANFLFTFVANFPKFMSGDDDDREKAIRAMKDALIGLNLIYQIPIVGSGIEIAINRARGERMPVEGTVNPISSVYRKIDKAYKETGEWTSAIRPAVEIGIGAQLDPLIGVYSGVADGFDENTMYDIMGISQSYRPSEDTKKEVEQKDKASERIEDISQFGMTRDELKKSNPDMYKIYFPVEAAEDEAKKQEKKRMQPPSSPFSNGSGKTPSPFAR